MYLCTINTRNVSHYVDDFFVYHFPELICLCDNKHDKEILLRCTPHTLLA